MSREYDNPSNPSGLDILIDKYTIPDVMFRHRPKVTQAPTPQQMAVQAEQANAYRNLTVPAQRPAVYQKALNIELVTGAAAVPISSTQFQCDGILLSVPTGGTSIFFGYGSGVTTGSGIEIRAGIPAFFSPDNNREQWELQRSLEALVGIIAQVNGYAPLDSFRSPRVYMDASQYWVIGTGAQTVAVMLFLSPEFQ